MSRAPRVLSQTGLYHVMFRGINKMNIFEDDEDFKKMHNIIKELKEAEKFAVYAYCFMTNHVHLFIKEPELGSIKTIMHKMLTRYVVWFNRKYKRSGSLVGNRYKSEAIEDEEYYFALVRYINQNPVRAGIVAEPLNYRWSSYRDYVYGQNAITDIDFTLDMLSEERSNALKMFEELHQTAETLEFVVNDSKKLTPLQIKRKIIKLVGISAEEIGSMPREDRNNALVTLRKAGLTIGELERTTGISRGIITNAREK